MLSIFRISFTDNKRIFRLLAELSMFFVQDPDWELAELFLDKASLLNNAKTA